MKKIILVISIFLLGLYFFYPAILNNLATSLVAEDPLGFTEMIVVLSGDSNGERVAEGVKLYKEGYAKKILMVGGSLAWKLSSAEWMKKQALELGVPASVVFLEGKSKSTGENALFALPILKKHGVSSILLVTSPYHTKRAGRVFRKVLAPEGITVITRAARESIFKPLSWWQDHEMSQLVVNEYLASFYYFLKGY
ncbi:MAG: YdcF family protein [bacterium]|nr:YdcF family protein [Candidatus Margulisiibacteriota bacterium]